MVSDETIKNKVNELFCVYPLLSTIVDFLHSHKARPYLVGGIVRDMVMGRMWNDVDIEVHGISLAALEQCLQQFGATYIVGKSFGVLQLGALPIDWSIPRTDSVGRKPHVTLDPTMGFEKAARRRDVTMNAMGIDLISKTVIDPFSGQKDIEEGVLRAPDVETFVEDPLRFFRVMQFISRFSMQPDKALNDVCKTMDISTVSHERIEQEFKKMMCLSSVPSQGLRWVESLGRLKEIMPELARLKGVEQNPHWHPEGDVFEHTMQVLDCAAQLTYADEQEKILIMYAALCHDLGKATTTKVIDGVIRSHGHEVAGVPIARALMARLTHAKDLIDDVALLVRHHMAPGAFIQNKAKAPAYKRLALAMASRLTLRQLAVLATADKNGRQLSYPLIIELLPDVEMFIEHAHRYGVLESPEVAVLTAADLLPQVSPGPALGEKLKKAYQIQIEEGITDKEVLKKRVL